MRRSDSTIISLKKSRKSVKHAPLCTKGASFGPVWFGVGFGCKSQETGAFLAYVRYILHFLFFDYPVDNSVDNHVDIFANCAIVDNHVDKVDNSPLHSI